jgi:uncharacterized protein DUF6627
MKTFPRQLRFWTALFLVLWMGAIDIAPAAAGLAPSRVSNATTITSTRDADMLMAQRALENKIVAQKLRDYGVSATEVKAKLTTMSDKDLHTLASASKGLPTGSDGAGAIIGILIIVILIIVILKLMNKEIVIK